MRKLALFLTAIAFFSCLALGITISNNTALPSLAVASAETPTSHPVQAPPIKQQNLLLIHVDQLTASQPVLKTAWGIFISVQEPGGVMFIPLLPAQDETATAKIVERFSIDKNLGLDRRFIEEVEENYEISADYTILIDDQGLQALSFWLNTPTTGSAPNPSLSQQEKEANIWRYLCGHIGPARQPDQTPFEWRSLFPDHAYTDMPFQSAITSWEALENSEGLVACEVFDTP